MIAQQEPQIIKFSKLRLWSENPRQPLDGEFSNEEIIKIAIEDQFGKYKLQTLIDNFGEFVDFSEMPTIVKDKKGDKYLVLDGNRRLCFIMALQDKALKELLYEKLSIEIDLSQIEAMSETWCNVCSMDTAIENVYRKHANNGSWSQLERDYFMTNYKEFDKTKFIYLEEQIGLIGADPLMNQGFVKTEVFSKKNIEDLGLKFNSKLGFTSNYNKGVATKIMQAVLDVVKNKHITTSKNRGKLLETIKEHYPETAKLISPFNPKKPSKLMEKSQFAKAAPKPRKKRRTKVVRGNDKLFGKTLYLKDGAVNNAYMALDRMYEKFKGDETTYLFFGANLRLLVELAGRVYYESINDNLKDADSVLKPFMKLAKKNVEIEKSHLTYISIVQNWLSDGGSNYVGILHKFAHGQVAAGKIEILETSYVVGAILEHYHKR